MDSGAASGGGGRKHGQRWRRKLEGLEGQAKLGALLEYMDYGNMLGTLEEKPTGRELNTNSCLYCAIGLRFEPVCDLPPKVISRATGLLVERPLYQPDGRSACHFLIARHPPHS